MPVFATQGLTFADVRDMRCSDRQGPWPEVLDSSRAQTVALAASRSSLWSTVSPGLALMDGGPVELAGVSGKPGNLQEFSKLLDGATSNTWAYGFAHERGERRVLPWR
jgi:hypothetical protein